MVGLIQTSRTAGGDHNGIGFNDIHGAVLNVETERPLDPVVFHEEIRDVDVILNRHLRQSLYGFCQDRLHVFAVDLQIAVAACHVLSVCIFEDHQPQTFHMLGHLIEPFRHGEKQIAANDPVGIFSGIVHIILRHSALCNIRIQCIDTGCQTAAAFDMSLFTDQHFCIRLICNGQCRIAAGCAAADDQYICFAAFDFHFITIFILCFPTGIFPQKPHSLHRQPPL